MTTRRSVYSFFAGGLLLGMSAGGMARAQPSGADMQSAAVDAYIYGYPLVTMELTRRSFTNVAKADGKSAPMGYFVNVPKYPPASDKRVTAPDADTLYSTAWIDVGKEPYILHVPDEPSGKFARPAKQSNWLPTTQNGKFIPMLRLYWPKETPPSMMDGTWKPPPIEMVSAP
jgi:hypothetical protein